MHEVAATVQEWIEAGRRTAFARVIEAEGFGGHSHMELFAMNSDGDTAGGLLAGTLGDTLLGTVTEVLGRPVGSGFQVFAGHVHGASASQAGLSCGGMAQVLVQRADHVPREFWSALVEQAPVALATVVEGPEAGPRALVVSADHRMWGSLGDPMTDRSVAETAAGMLGGGTAAVRRIESGSSNVLVEVLVPDPRLVVVGGGSLSEALVAQAALLGWRARVVADVEGAAEAVAWAAKSGAVVVLSHAPDIDAPALALAIGHRAFYVGALGSRRTQAARSARLQALGVAGDEIDRIRGPVGLDLGGQSPALIALSICAEILAVRTGRDATPLRNSSGPIRQRSLTAPTP
jgi:xanthine dehydrogenase accessory factor